MKQNRELCLSNKVCWENWMLIHERMKLGQYFTPHTKINTLCFKDVNERPETVKHLEENTNDTGLGNRFFWDLTPKPKATKVKVNKWSYVKLQSFFTAKRTISKMKNRQAARWQKTFVTHII